MLCTNKLIYQNIARIAKLPYLMSELKKMFFCRVGRSSRYVRKVGQWVKQQQQNNNNKTATKQQQQNNNKKEQKTT